MHRSFFSLPKLSWKTFTMVPTRTSRQSLARHLWGYLGARNKQLPVAQPVALSKGRANFQDGPAPWACSWCERVLGLTPVVFWVGAHCVSVLLSQPDKKLFYGLGSLLKIKANELKPGSAYSRYPGAGYAKRTQLLSLISYADIIYAWWLGLSELNSIGSHQSQRKTLTL